MEKQGCNIWESIRPSELWACSSKVSRDCDCASSDESEDVNCGCLLITPGSPDRLKSPDPSRVSSPGRHIRFKEGTVLRRGLLDLNLCGRPVGF